jgi:putative transposase
VLRVGFPIQGIDRIAGFNEKILARYARGMKARGISLQLEELYGAQVSLTLVSEVTDSGTEEVKVQ